MDSNHDKGLQRALCYHYTIGQRGEKLAFRRGQCKEKFQRIRRRGLDTRAPSGQMKSKRHDREPAAVAKFTLKLFRHLLSGRPSTNQRKSG